MTIPTESFALISGLPGEELVAVGLHDLAGGNTTSAEALLILMARTRLAQAGLSFLKNSLPPTEKSAESLLYQSLSEDDAETAYSRYNSLKRRLNSFLRCLESRTDARTDARRSK